MTFSTAFCLIADMMKTLLLVISAGSLGSLGACTQDSTPLSELHTMFGNTSLEIVAKEQINIELHVDTTRGCPVLGDDVVATFDGEPMAVARGGYDTDAHGCYPIAFWMTSFPADRIASWELRGAQVGSQAGSALKIQDATATWTVSPTRLFTNELVVDAAASRLVWQDIPEISTARLVPSVDVKIQGNSIYYPPGTVITYADAYAHPTPTQCDGPTTCTVNVERIRQFGPANPR
jgi:hypothetical protein